MPPSASAAARAAELARIGADPDRRGAPAIIAPPSELRGVLDYDDLIVKARNLLRTRGDAAQWVLYKLDGGIDHMLVDEAQDTSPEQWDDRAQADRGILRRRRAASGAIPAPSSRWATRSSPSSASRAPTPPSSTSTAR